MGTFRALSQQFEVRTANILFQHSHVQSDIDHAIPIVDYCSHVQLPEAEVIDGEHIYDSIFSYVQFRLIINTLVEIVYLCMEYVIILRKHQKRD